MCISVPGEAPDHKHHGHEFDTLSEQLAGIHDAAARASGVRNAADAELVALIAEVDSLGSWAVEGASSMEHWIGWQLGASRSRARNYLSIARRRSELPHAHALFAAGRLSVDQMLAITKHCPTEFDHDVAEFARYATITQLNRSLRKYVFDEPGGNSDGCDDSDRSGNGGAGCGEPDPVKDPDEVAGAADFWAGEDGFNLRMRGGQADGLRLKAMIEHAKAWLDVDRGNIARASTYDALMFLIEQGVTADPSTHRPARARVFIHFDVDQRDRWHHYQHLGDALHPDVVKLLTCDAETQTVLTKSGRSPHLGRKHRIVPDWLRDVILDRDGCCRVPGCGRSLGLDVHHIKHWSDGGETTPENLVTLCRRHHTLHHQGCLDLDGNPEQVFAPGTTDGLTFTNQHGRPIKHPPPDPAPPPRDRPDPPIYRHPTGEPLDYWAVHFNRNRPDDSGDGTG